MIKVSKIFRILIYFSALFMLGYIKAFISIPGNEDYYRLLLALVGILVAFWVYNRCSVDSTLRACCKNLSKYMKIYLPIILFAMIYSWLAYGYSINGLLITATPYLLVFWAYPIVYVLYRDRTSERILHAVFLLVLGILAIKFIGWYMYGFRGVVMFRNLLFQYADWTRSELQRVDTGYLFSIAFAYALYGIYKKKNKIPYMIAAVDMALFMVFITQYRYLQITMIIEFLLVYYYASETSKTKFIRLVLLAGLIAVFILSGGLDSVLNSFSVRGSEAGSTIARIDTVIHYWGLLKEKNGLFGLGLLSGYNATTANMMARWGSERFWLSDIGILGGFFTFGILSIPLYFGLFRLAFNTCKKALKKGNNAMVVIAVGLTAYMIISCLLMNVFDGQRVYDVPFYLALYSYWNYKLDDDEQKISLI